MAVTELKHYGGSVAIVLPGGSVLRGRPDYARLYVLTNAIAPSMFDLPPVGNLVEASLPKHPVLPGGPHFIVCIPDLTDFPIVVRDYWGVPRFNIAPGQMCIICLEKDDTVGGKWVIGCMALAVAPPASTSSPPSSSSSASPSPSSKPTASSTTFVSTSSQLVTSLTFVTGSSSSATKQPSGLNPATGPQPSGPPYGVSAW